jgi:hypothetical protein
VSDTVCGFVETKSGFRARSAGSLEFFDRFFDLLFQIKEREQVTTIKCHGRVYKEHTMATVVALFINISLSCLYIDGNAIDQDQTSIGADLD